MGTAAQRATPDLIQATQTWPRNFDTGDGVIPVRDSILEALGRTGDPRAVDPLMRALSDPRPLGALRGLELLGPSAARSVPRILSVLNAARATDRSVVEAGARALASIGDPAGLPFLEQLMQEDPNRNDRSRIREAIDRMRLQRSHLPKQLGR
jgi:HEAT repeat protein